VSLHFAFAGDETESRTTIVTYRLFTDQNYALTVRVLYLLRCWIAILALAGSTAQFTFCQDETPRVRRVTERSVPSYPDLARRLNLVGVVKLRVTVAPDGVVIQSEVLGGNPVLAKSAQDAVRKWRWATASRETEEEVLLNFHPK
jgi:TonB family protein